MMSIGKMVKGVHRIDLPEKVRVSTFQVLLECVCLRAQALECDYDFAVSDDIRTITITLQ